MNPAAPSTQSNPTTATAQDQPGISAVVLSCLVSSCFASAMLFPPSEKFPRRPCAQRRWKSEYQRSPQNLFRRQSLGAPKSPEDEQTEAERQRVADEGET